MRRKFATVTPGIALGYWNARKMPSREHVRAPERDGALRHLVGRVAHEDVGECRLAGAVRPHDGVHAAPIEVEVDAAEDLRAVDRRMQIANAQVSHEVP
jgi:hypothetical protein